MDLKGSLIDTNIKIYPTKALTDFLGNICVEKDTPINILKLIKDKDYEQTKLDREDIKLIQLNDKDIENLNRIKDAVITAYGVSEESELATENLDNNEEVSPSKEAPDIKNNTEQGGTTSDDKSKDESASHDNEKTKERYLTTLDIDWLYTYLQNQKKKGSKDVPYLTDLLEGARIEMPENQTIKRNPILEARCVKLRAQQEAREYRKMTKTVDNVRMRFPEDSISYQLKQVNRQLIAIGQFIISIFAGFLFGFKGIEWMVGDLEFGFRLLMGVMCALVIALAEIYFLAKKLNEELNIPETIQLGGPPKFANEPSHTRKEPTEAIDKEHQD